MKKIAALLAIASIAIHNTNGPAVPYQTTETEPRARRTSRRYNKTAPVKPMHATTSRRKTIHRNKQAARRRAA